MLFQPVQEQVTELAGRLLPEITTVEIGPGELQGTNLVAWRHDLQLASVVPADEADPANAAAMPPPTLIVLNPGDPDPASIEMQDRGAAVTKA